MPVRVDVARGHPMDIGDRLDGAFITEESQDE
jgi:hypothetical protein